MSVSPQIANWVTCELIASDNQSQVMETVFNYKSSTQAISESDLLLFASGWRDIMKPLVQAVCPSQIRFDSVKCKTHFIEFPNVEAVAYFPAGTYGSVAGDNSPGNAALVVKLLTGIVGRRNRGRQFMFGIPEGFTSGSLLNAGALGAYAAIWTRHLLGFTYAAVNYLPAVASRKGLYLRVVIEFFIDYFIDSQRRRLIGRGR